MRIDHLRDIIDCYLFNACPELTETNIRYRPSINQSLCFLNEADTIGIENIAMAVEQFINEERKEGRRAVLLKQ